VESLQRFRHKVSTLFLDIKGGFDNVSASVLMAHLRMKGVSEYLITWIGSFLRERTCRLVFQGSPQTFRPVQVGVPQGSPISPLLFVIYVSSLHMDIPRTLTISYVDDLALTAASQSWEENTTILRDAYARIRSIATPRGISFSVPKTELIHWRTPRDQRPRLELPSTAGRPTVPPHNTAQMAGLLVHSLPGWERTLLQTT
jgi:hypothetical protein